MKYRKLGKTGMEVSCIGLGCAQLGSSRSEYAVQIVRQALAGGVNYFDTARVYWDSEIKVGEGLGADRGKVYISSKTTAKTREEAWQHINESLERLRTDYLDNYHLHALADTADVELRLGPDGALEALREAKEKGLIRHIGCTSHRSSVLIEAIKRFDFEIILIPMNIVEREPLDELIPLCMEREIGVTIMKPVATGLLPANLALKWLLTQPIATAVPGATTVEEAEENSAVGSIEDPTLTQNELDQVAELRENLEQVRCRICKACEPCPVDIPIASTLGTDVMYDHYRTMGKTTFVSFPWSEDRIKDASEQRLELIQKIEACNDCGLCDERCPYGLPVSSMLKSMVPAMNEMVTLWRG
jgi:predicted aldo/keto reductase-like oxidoreductase